MAAYHKQWFKKIAFLVLHAYDFINIKNSNALQIDAYHT